MNETVFTANNLTKKYKTSMALDGLAMEVKRGDIYGFIGANGAGKTTTTRIMTGLIKPTAGEFSLFGKSNRNDMENQRKRIGCMVENPMLYPEMTAAENMEIERLQRGIPGRSQNNQLLKLLKLEDVGNKKVKHFSLGMKQRLAIAMALLTSPELLILDEPMNGLDPGGIIEVRELLQKLNREHGITIIISSHILGELFLLSTCYGILHNGKMMTQLTAKSLKEKCQKYLSIKVDDSGKAVNILERNLHTNKFTVHPDRIIRLYDYLDKPGYVNHELNVNGVVADEVMLAGTTLEDYFNQVIGGEI